MIYKHVFNFVLNELLHDTIEIKKHFSSYRKYFSKNWNVHDCNEIDMIGFDNYHEIHYCKCSYYKYKKSNRWIINEMGNIIESFYFDDEFLNDEIGEQEDYADF